MPFLPTAAPTEKLSLRTKDRGIGLRMEMEGRKVIMSPYHSIHTYRLVYLLRKQNLLSL
jgi:hypothetical protein